ncbi:DUF2075 family protein/predicted GIY-YIG superfamily endonuclease [Cellulosimicrobium cellulans]|uniref:DUF2075 domain-containing protein n=1 Tax=Cellulosimicrobium cellulans TaxID=1710 RepID=UPI001959E1B8|nr:DUF2075 domain-containing protein [Cellulosimicrobium cellulans]MBM7820362.1 DUF2075 family protein/predicted GIY-YIG superfamily endonuclease [Cellulosimicrobium cellulans]
MTRFEVEHLPFHADAVNTRRGDRRLTNWPVVYAIDGDRDIYVGETLNAVARMRQHLDTSGKAHLRGVRIVVDETFNKSVCLDLESHLIRWFSGDGHYQVLNRNFGIVDADYYDRSRYRDTFRAVFEELRAQGLFTRSISQIENSDLFKLSPFKALNSDQAIAVEDILEGLFDDLRSDRQSTIVVQGDPGTGKTIVGIYLMKLLRDIETADLTEALSAETVFSEFFAEGYPELLKDFKVGLVVPQQSLRASIQEVFRKTPGLRKDMVLTPFQVGESTETFDLLIVDETHRLNQRASLASGVLNAKFPAINHRLFGADDLTITQLDWIREKSRHQIFLLDSGQRVRPADLPTDVLDRLVEEAREAHRLYPLSSQMRVLAGHDYVAYIREILAGQSPTPRRFGGYELRMFDDLGEMRDAIRAREAEYGLARLVAGYAFPWRSRADPSAPDIDLDGLQMPWNRTSTDWISSPTSIDEVGSIHTVQGYDLNYAGVIIGGDMRYDPASGRLYFERGSYFDSKGMQNNTKRGITYDDDDLLAFVTNIYAVLLTRGMRGTFVYVVDPELRTHLRAFIDP